MSEQSIVVDLTSIASRDRIGLVGRPAVGSPVRLLEPAARRDIDDAVPAVGRVLRAQRVSDAVAVGLVTGIVAVVVGRMHGLPLVQDGVAAVLAALLAAPLWLALLGLARAYEPRFLFAGTSESQRVAVAGAAAGLVICAGGWLTLEPADAAVVLPGLAAVVGLTVAGRWMIRSQAQRANRDGVTRSRVLVVGDREDTMPLISRLERNLYHGWQVVADCRPASEQGLGVAGHEAAMRRIVRAAERADAAVVLLTPGAGAALSSVADLQRVLADAGRELAFAPPLVEAVGPRVSVHSICGLPVVRLSPPELAGTRRAVKALADRVAAAAALVLLLPLLLGVGLVVRLTSRGPAVFKQRRVGRDGRLFTIWKYRTMHVDADARQAAVDAANEGAGPLFKMRRDPRITAVGRWLRTTSLDELPQLVNVLRGEMSIVGPRPALPREVAEYDAVTRRRLRVRPGITGLWQIHGRSDLSWEETKRLDVRYVENWSLGFDLSIILRTVDAVVRGRGAY